MALTIDKASIGFDANGMQQALNNINVNVIEATKNAMTNNMGSLRESVDNAWVGASAEQFKANMEKDRETVSKALDSTFEALKTAMYDAINQIQENDRELVKERGE